jgi:hypothetical protein
MPIVLPVSEPSKVDRDEFPKVVDKFSVAEVA